MKNFEISNNFKMSMKNSKMGELTKIISKKRIISKFEKFEHENFQNFENLKI